MNIVYVASEENPFAKTGGLADVLGSLPQSAAEANGGGKTKVLTFLPKYAAVDTQRYPLRPVGGEISVPIGPRLEKGQVWTLTQPLETAPNVKSYFIENRKYFDRPTLYGYGSDDFKDNNERFTFFARGVLEFCKNIGFAPDILHCHDWQTGLIPAYLKIVYHSDPFFQRTRTIFTIHNIAYQGIFPAKTVALAGFPDSEFTPEKLEYYGQLSMLKAGILYADKVTTVSPAYAREVVENPNFGRGMDGLLRERQHDFVGILNGLDYGEWNPAQDSYLAGTFSPRSKNWSAQKKKCKADLQKQIGLPADERVPLVGMVSRLDTQKGFGKIPETVRRLTKQKIPCQWAILGVGDKKIQESLLALQKKNKKSFAVHLGFSPDLAHKIYGGSDLFAMPSEFEPCGLSQMISMKYGTIPVVTPTGGLRDTVLPWNSKTKKGTGFVSASLSADSWSQSLIQAIQTMRKPIPWAALRKNAMKTNFSWKRSAKEYIKLYLKALA